MLPDQCEWKDSCERVRLNYASLGLPCFSLYFIYVFIFYSITRTFASGKTEKGIFQALKDLGLPSGKVRSLAVKVKYLIHYYHVNR